jgi:surfactin synthase thioesterase subunit
MEGDVATDVQTGKWVIASDPNPFINFRLFCLPHAGAGATLYRQWVDEVPPTVHFCRIQLPGREERLHEQPLASAAEITRTLVQELRPWLDLPFALFGNSMGALLAFELAREFRRAGQSLPAHLFLSGRPAPHVKSRIPAIHHLADGDFKRELGRLNGTPLMVLNDAELMGLLMPTLRADFSVCETYNCAPEEPLTIPITVFGAIGDVHVHRENLVAWQGYTTASFRVRMFPGDHFYLQTARSGLISAIVADLSPYLLRSASSSNLVRRSAGGDAM